MRGVEIPAATGRLTTETCSAASGSPQMGRPEPLPQGGAFRLDSLDILHVIHILIYSYFRTGGDDARHFPK